MDYRPTVGQLAQSDRIFYDCRTLRLRASQSATKKDQVGLGLPSTFCVVTSTEGFFVAPDTRVWSLSLYKEIHGPTMIFDVAVWIVAWRRISSRRFSGADAQALTAQGIERENRRPRPP